MQHIEPWVTCNASGAFRRIKIMKSRSLTWRWIDKKNLGCRRHPCVVESEKHIIARHQHSGIAWKNRCQLLTGLREGQIDEALFQIVVVRRRTRSEEGEI